MFRYRIHQRKQFGFRTQLPDGQSFVCLGDEPYNVINRSYVENADWLLCEAFCLYEDREVFQPYKKHHSTALDAGRLAAELGVKNLVLYHTEDRNLIPASNLICVKLHKHSPEPFMYRTIWKGLTFE